MKADEKHNLSIELQDRQFAILTSMANSPVSSVRLLADKFTKDKSDEFQARILDTIVSKYFIKMKIYYYLNILRILQNINFNYIIYNVKSHQII